MFPLTDYTSSYLADIDLQTQEQLDTIIQQLTQAQGITEELKAVDQMGMGRQDK